MLGLDPKKVFGSYLFILNLIIFNYLGWDWILSKTAGRQQSFIQGIYI
jgi:hypothetical protein